MGFETERFIQDCIKARAEGDSHTAMRDLLAETVADPAAVIAGLGEPEKAGFNKIYHSETLTILNVVWAPLMTLMPHNHNMWAVIGVYGGREDNIFWRRTDAGLEAAGATDMHAGQANPLGPDIIHSVTNPIEKLTGAIHIYGGDFFNEPRSEWDPEDFTERPYDTKRNQQRFEEANARFFG